MSSVAFSLGAAYIPRRHRSTTNNPLTVASINKANSAAATVAPLQAEEGPKVVLNRRSAIGILLGVGLSGSVVFRSEETEAAEQQGASSCELTVSPSGLAFCDKVVGYGAEAQKGQLIKVISKYGL